MASPCQAGEAEVAGQRHPVGDHEVPLVRKALLEHRVAGEAEADAGFDEVDHGLDLVGIGDAFRDRTQRSENAVEQPLMRERRRRGKPRQTGEIRPFLSHHLVGPFRRRDHAVVITQQRCELECTAFDRAFGISGIQKRLGRRRVNVVSDVEFALADFGKHIAASAIAQGDLGLLRRRGEAADEGPEPGDFGIEDGADAERFTLRVLERTRHRPEIGGGGYGLVRQREQGGPRLGQGEAARRAVEKLQADAFLEPLQLQADGRLGQVQQAGRPRNRALTGYGNEATQRLGARELVHLKRL